MDRSIDRCFCVGRGYHLLCNKNLSKQPWKSINFLNTFIYLSIDKALEVDWADRLIEVLAINYIPSNRQNICRSLSSSSSRLCDRFRDSEVHRAKCYGNTTYIDKPIEMANFKSIKALRLFCLNFMQNQRVLSGVSAIYSQIERLRASRLKTISLLLLRLV